jgi:futalosine hydrolase
VELDDCEALRLATSDCRLVLLAATEVEAEPLLGALIAPESYTVATKKLFVGGLEVERSRDPEGLAAVIVRAALAISGCDKTNVAHALTCLLQAVKPKPVLVLQFGVGGAFPSAGRGAGARVGDIVLATEEIYSDTGSSSPSGWLSAQDLGLPVACAGGRESGGRFPLEEPLVRSAAALIQTEAWPEPRPEVVTGPCVTASRVTGLSAEGEETAARWGAVAESMEGAAAAHICALYAVPFLEIRGISNLILDRDRDSWEVERGVAVAARAALVVGAALDRLPLAASACPAASAGPADAVASPVPSADGI